MAKTKKQQQAQEPETPAITMFQETRENMPEDLIPVLDEIEQKFQAVENQLAMLSNGSHDAANITAEQKQDIQVDAIKQFMADLKNAAAWAGLGREHDELVPAYLEYVYEERPTEPRGLRMGHYRIVA